MFKGQFYTQHMCAYVCLCVFTLRQYIAFKKQIRFYIARWFSLKCIMLSSFPMHFTESSVDN